MRGNQRLLCGVSVFDRLNGQRSNFRSRGLQHFQIWLRCSSSLQTIQRGNWRALPSPPSLTWRRGTKENPGPWAQPGEKHWGVCTCGKVFRWSKRAQEPWFCSSRPSEDKWPKGAARWTRKQIYSFQAPFPYLQVSKSVGETQLEVRREAGKGYCSFIVTTPSHTWA